MRVLHVPAQVDFGPYRSLERVEASTRAALAERFELIELDAHPGRDKDGYLAAFAAAQPLDAVIDHSDHALHGPVTPDTPTLFYALGGMPNGVTMPWLRRRRLKSTDAFLVNCTSDLTIYERTMMGTGPRAELLPFGIDPLVFRPRGEADDRATRAALGVPEDAFVLLYAGRLNIQKNLHSVLYALREVAAREPRAHLVLAGGFDSIAHLAFEVTNEGYEEHLRQLIDNWGLAERVHFAGSLADEDLARAYSAASVFVTLTLHNNENFGYAPVEAMACGTPVVGSHFGGLKDTVVHGETGYHVETAMTSNGLRAAWRQAIAPLLAMAGDEALVRRLSANATARAHERYSLRAYANRLETIVRTTVARCQTERGHRGDNFRFAPPAMQLHMRNLYRTFTREERKARGETRRGPRIEYDSYRFFQGPYATRDADSIALAEDDLLALVTRCRLDRRNGVLESFDPIWPGRYELSPAELATIGAVEPGTRVGDALARGAELGLTGAAARALLARLVSDGVIYPDRTFHA